MIFSRERLDVACSRSPPLLQWLLFYSNLNNWLALLLLLKMEVLLLLFSIILSRLVVCNCYAQHKELPLADDSNKNEKLKP
jgi:hypothetical protein